MQLELLGEGSQKKVYRVKWQTGEAALMLPKLHATLQTEATLMEKARAATNLLQMLFCQPHYLIVELAKYGSAADYADTLEFVGKRLSPHEVDEIMHGAELGVRQLNELGFRHGDLRAQNILIFEVGPVFPKLGDFGEAAPGHTSAEELSALERELRAL